VDGLVAGLVMLVLLALVVFGLDKAIDVRHQGHTSSGGKAAVAAARKEVLALTTISASSTNQDIDRILAGASKGFRAQFEDQATTFRKALSDAQVDSTGKIASAGLASFTGSKAQVLIAASGTVKNKKTTSAQPRNYRLKVSLVKSGGDWLVSGMDFVS
jgi:Mce-associated membrane protein